MPEPEKKKQTWKEWLAHAFAVDGGNEPLAPEDAALVEKIAKGVVARRMTAPALLFLESIRPVSFVGGQALIFFQPMLEMVLKASEVERAAKLLERRTFLEGIAVKIEALEAEKKP